jgi:hypothetical protein
LKTRIDFVSIVRRYTRLKRSGKQYFGLCPFHQERHPSFYVHPQKKVFFCFGCRVGGDVFDFILRIEGCDFPRALEIAERLSGGASEGRPVFGRPERAGAKPPGLRSRPPFIARKPEPQPRSASSANRWPSIEDCAAERAAEIYTPANNFPEADRRGHR